MATLSRFISRRGCPADIHSDNGTNFLGAREEIRELQDFIESKSTKNAISHFTTHNGIHWHHIPPRTPHFAGLWEAAVRMIKQQLRKNLQPHSLRWDELYTVLTEAKAILNSRPLMPLHSEEASEGMYLTPGHFINGKPLRAPPTKLPPTAKISDLCRWNLVSRVKSDLWRQWCSFYLASCAQRSKWMTPARRTLKPKDLVFVRDETLRTRDWPVAVIEKVHPGDDGEAVPTNVPQQRLSPSIPTKTIPRLHPEKKPNIAAPGVCLGFCKDVT